MYVARKISRAKWDPRRNIEQGLEADDISSDAVTADLRTHDSTLSFWRCPTGSTNEIDDVALAIASANDRISKLDVVWISEKKLMDSNLSIRNSPGDTPLRDLVDNHIDIEKLDISRLGIVAKIVSDEIKNGNIRRFGFGKVKNMLRDACNAGRISVSSLPEGISKEITQSDG